MSVVGVACVALPLAFVWFGGIEAAEERARICRWWRDVMLPMCETCGEPLIWLDLPRPHPEGFGYIFERRLACRVSGHRTAELAGTEGT